MKDLENKWLQRYVGYQGERDEYQKSKIFEILAHANMLMFYLTTALMMVSFIWDAIHQQYTLGTFLLLGLQQFNSYYVIFKTKKYGVQQTEFYDEKSYTLASKSLRKKSLWAGLNWGFSMFIVMTIVFPTLWHDSIRISWWNVLIYLVGGTFFGGTMYLISKSQLKIITDNSD